ncbi:hypothetical protein PF66_06380 [Pseudomonas asplenii]|uniref:Uncharacterized protein n=1 Tax=Pseudomonas asplenii TaxID=53407 RepID=A0A0N0E0Z1_9PSED|nr:hypothetical protein [Pseudomonas fuscovaginae]KPA87035.1 hypothetical protein PF66_06380 [Pseudomonas fuscovaginae]
MSYSRTDYYAEGLAESFEEHGITATREQIKAVASDVAAWAESIGMAFQVPAGDPRDSELADLRKQLDRERNKVICRECKGSGEYVSRGPHHSSFGRCFKCRGEGRHAP